MKLGELLRSRRAALGLTMQEVGDAAGLTKSYIYDLETSISASPSIQVCVRLSIALGLTINQIAAAAIAVPNE